MAFGTGGRGGKPLRNSRTPISAKNPCTFDFNKFLFIINFLFFYLMIVFLIFLSHTLYINISNKMSIVFNKKSDHRILDQIFKFLEA